MKKALIVVVFGLLFILGFFFSVTVGDYPKLNSCFKTSVSKKLLCPQNPDYVQLGSISKYFLDAVVMSEDDKFYAHEGFDWKEFRKSMEANLRQFSFVRGGSTITQQLVKNVYLTREKTISRKIVEARLARRIEKRQSKKLILEKYVNAIEFGKNIWGIKQAANFYFKKSPGQLNPLESLYLAILLPSPVRYSKTYFKKELSSYQKKRMTDLLSRMRRRKMISNNQFDQLEFGLSEFLSVANVGNLVPEDEWFEEDEDEDVVLPEEGEMTATEITIDTDVEKDLESAPLELKEKEEDEQVEEPYPEENTVIEDVEPGLEPHSKRDANLEQDSKSTDFD